VTESDGIEEALEDQMRAIMTAAGRAGQQLARLHEQRLADARRSSEREGREYAAQLRDEREAARAQTAPVSEAEWWDRATPVDIGKAYTTTRTWSDVDPEADRAGQRIRDEVRTRYGADVNDAGVDPAAAEHDLARAGAREDFYAREPEMAQAAAARDDGRSTYDTAGRREAFASELERAGIDGETIATRIRADVSQGRPATEATRTASTKAPSAGKGSGGRVQQSQLDGLTP
jgi:hypothetical protein